jgi:hypothetical protein
MKLLVVNLQNPNETKYINPKSIGSFMLGRRISNYPVFIVSNDGQLTQLFFENADVISIEKKVYETLALLTTKPTGKQNAKSIK